MPVTPGGGSGSPPINILIGRYNPDTDITAKVDLTTVRVEETGNQESATFDAVLLDKVLAFTTMRAEWRIAVNWRNPVTGAWSPMFRGFIRTPSPEIKAIYGEFALHAEDCGTLLDKVVVDTQGVVRAAGESDKARIQWLFGGLRSRDGIRVAQPLLAEGFNDWRKVQTLNASMGRQTFPPRLTLRQALERILSQASDTADYYVDHVPRLWTFDSDTISSVLDRAPYNVDTTTTGSTVVAPEDLTVEWDSTGLWTGFYAKAATAKLSRVYLDSDPFTALANPLPGPYAVDLFGRRIGYFNAPDADTRAKVERAVKAALRDTRNPVPRITFSVEESSAYNATTGDRWRGGQLVNVKSTIHGLNGTSTDAGPWAGSSGTGSYLLQPFRIKRVVTTFLSGDGDMRCEIEAGGRKKVLYSGGA